METNASAGQETCASFILGKWPRDGGPANGLLISVMKLLAPVLDFWERPGEDEPLPLPGIVPKIQ